jgi:hypothetical protein
MATTVDITTEHEHKQQGRRCTARTAVTACLPDTRTHYGKSPAKIAVHRVLLRWANAPSNCRSSGMEGLMETVDLIEPGRHRSKVTSVQVRRNFNGEVYFVTVLGRILEGEHKNEPWMDILRTDHPLPPIAKSSQRKLAELLTATGVEQVEQAKGKQVVAILNVLGAENVVSGYRQTTPNH